MATIIACLAVTSMMFSGCKKDKQESENPDYVLINGVKWATRNVGMPGTFVENPEDFGEYYQWNRETPDWTPDWNGYGADTWEIAHCPCPAGWRVPTESELKKLANSGSSWGTLNGIDGRFFGNGEQTIFLPAAGKRDSNKEGEGSYWSSNMAGTGNNRAKHMSFDKSNGGIWYVNTYRYTGCSVRCVKE
ncbi:MAG: fibrobacter succinogenes major paralogous domain-containing protein [Bacteroidales bacterium]|nr:fibrobacter succinogenes major paralogous domain-containing protein [Bacteroidales bacterium]